MARRRLPPLTRCRARRVAVLKLSALGDVVHALPVLPALRRRFPGARVTWVVNRAYADLLDGNPDLDEVLPFDRHLFRGGVWEGVRDLGRFVGELRRRRFDLVIDLQGLLRSGLMAAATGAARRVGFAGAREGAAWCYTDTIAADHEAMHAVDRYWRVAEALGVGGAPKRFVLPVRDAERRWAEELLRPYPRPWLAVAPGARWVTKRWPAEHFAELLRRAQRRFGGTAILIGGGDEIPAAAEVARRPEGPVVDLAGRTRLAQVVALLARADAVLANDSGPLHLAAALGRPVVAPYTCTQVRRHGPYGAGRGAVETGVWCRGSYVKKCPRLECMRELTPERLWPALEEVLSAWESSCRSA